MRKLFTFIVLSFVSLAVVGQVEESEDFTVDYSSPKTLTIGGIDVQGVRYLDRNALIQTSGLAVGDEVKVPGSAFTDAHWKLWRLQMFSDMSIEVERVVGDKVWVVIYLQERPRLSDFNFFGVTKSEIKDISEKVALLKGTQVVDNQLVAAERIIKGIFKEKGFLNTEVNIVQRDDPDQSNSVILDIKIDKKEKVKIQQINFHGIEQLSKSTLERSMKKTNSKSLKNILRTKKFLEEKYREDKANLISKYNEKGYRDATIVADTVTPLGDNRAQIDIWLEEGRKYYFGNIRWMGNTIYASDYLSAVLGVKKGDVFDQKQLDKRLSDDQESVTIGGLYQDHGYLFYTLNPVEINIYGDTIDFEMRIHEGMPATINDIFIEGNTKTHEHVIRREIRTLPGDLYRRKDIIRTVRELSQLGFVDPERINPDLVPHQEDGTVDINYQLEEKSTDQIEVSGGWGARMFVGTLGLRFANFSIRNIFNMDSWRPLPTGDGQTLSLRAQTSGKFYQSYSVSFMEPWLGGKKPNSLSLSFSYSKVNYSANNYYGRSGYNPYSYGYGYGSYGYGDYYNNYGYGNYNTGGSTGRDQIQRTIAIAAGYGYRMSWPDDYFTMYHELSYEHYSLQNMSSYYYFLSDGENGDGKFNNFSFKTAFGRNSVDNPLYPRNGSDISLSVQATIPFSLLNNKNYDSQSMTNQERYRWIEYHKWKLKGDWYLPITRNENLVFHSKFEYGFLGYYNESIRSPFQRFRLGGSGMSGYNLYGADIVPLRGYQDYSLSPTYGSNLYDKLSLELRYPIMMKTASQIYTLVFLDAGNAWMNFEDFDAFDLKRAAGVGVRVFMPMFGMMGIDWGYGFDKIPGNPGAGGSQFHFVLGQQL